MSDPSRSRPLWAVLLVVPVLFAALAALQVRIDAQARAMGDEREELLLRSPATLKQLSLGYDSLLADLYWTRAIQYYGERMGTEHARFDLLWPLLDITTTLDPRLIVAYRFGAVFLSEPGLGAGRPDLAVELVHRGIAENPLEWRLYADLGFLYYWWLQDYPNAATAYLEGSKIPGAPPLLKFMAARVAEKGGAFETSRMIWLEIYQSSKDPRVRNRALEMLAGLRAEEDEVHLDEIAEAYKQRFGRYPATTVELRDAGLLAGIPVDPSGYPYVFGPDGKSRLNPNSSVVIPPPVKTRRAISK